MIKGAKKRIDLIYAAHKNDDESATYDALTGRQFTAETGYQFSFVRPEAYGRLNEDDWDRLTAHIMERTGSREYVGVTPQWGGETSFYCKDIKSAAEFMHVFNQDSILDWGMKSKYPDPKDWQKWFIQNGQQTETEVDYDAFLKTI
jgi:hypothetical protein